MSNEYDTGELSPDAVRALKRVVDQFAATEVLLTKAMQEVGHLPAMVQHAAREIQYAYGDNRASRYGPCDDELGRALASIGNASASVKAVHEGAIAMLAEGTDGKVALRRPRTKALHRIANDLLKLWPGQKFGR